jgi:hypothetical protein
MVKYRIEAEVQASILLLQNSGFVGTLNSFCEFTASGGNFTAFALDLIAQVSDLIVFLDAIGIAVDIGVPNGSPLLFQITHFILQ